MSSKDPPDIAEASTSGNVTYSNSFYALHDVATDLPQYDEARATDPQTILAQIKSSLGPSHFPIRSDLRTQNPREIYSGTENAAMMRRIHSRILKTFFDSVQGKGDEIVALFIESGIVTPETTNTYGVTPLLAAITAGNVRMIQELVDLGADVNAYGKCPRNVEAGWARYGLRREWDLRGVPRTPLQLAAALGNLTIVKLLYETYGADDRAVALDGQLAFRLAARNGHREVTAYLPARRGGAGVRLGFVMQHFLGRLRKLGRVLEEIARFFLWTLPRCLLWDLPVELAKRAHRFPGWCLRQIKKTPDRLKRLGKRVVRTIKATPWWIKRAAAWVKGVLQTAFHGIKSILEKAVSAIHTAVVAVVSFFRDVTLADILAALRHLGNAMAELPLKMFRALKKVVHLLGDTLHFIVWIIWEVSIYVPKQMWKTLVALFELIKKGVEEALFYISPNLVTVS